jgi:hypothetical protein
MAPLYVLIFAKGPLRFDGVWVSNVGSTIILGIRIQHIKFGGHNIQSIIAMFHRGSSLSLAIQQTLYQKLISPFYFN